MHMSELRHFAVFTAAFSAIAIALGIGLRVFRPQDFRQHAGLFWSFLLSTTAIGVQALLQIWSFLPDSWVLVGQFAFIFAQWIGVLWIVAVLLRYFVRHDYSGSS